MSDQPVHLARAITSGGQIRPWCYLTRRVLPPRAKWTNRESAATCRRCLIHKSAARAAKESSE